MGPRAHPFESVIRTSSTAGVLRPIGRFGVQLALIMLRGPAYQLLEYPARLPTVKVKNLTTVTGEGIFTQPRLSSRSQSHQSWTGKRSGALARLSTRRPSRPGEAPSRRRLRAGSQEIREVEGRWGRASAERQR